MFRSRRGHVYPALTLHGTLLLHRALAAACSCRSVLVFTYLIWSPTSGTFSLKKRKSWASSKSLWLATFFRRDLKEVSIAFAADCVFDDAQPKGRGRGGGARHRKERVTRRRGACNCSRCAPLRSVCATIPLRQGGAPGPMPTPKTCVGFMFLSTNSVAPNVQHKNNGSTQGETHNLYPSPPSSGLVTGWRLEATEELEGNGLFLYVQLPEREYRQQTSCRHIPYLRPWQPPSPPQLGQWKHPRP